MAFWSLTVLLGWGGVFLTDVIRTIRDPEHPYSLEELSVVDDAWISFVAPNVVCFLPFRHTHTHTHTNIHTDDNKHTH